MCSQTYVPGEVTAAATRTHRCNPRRLPRRGRPIPCRRQRYQLRTGPDAATPAGDGARSRQRRRRRRSPLRRRRRTEALHHRWPVARTEDRSICLSSPHRPHRPRKWPELRTAEIKHLSVPRPCHQPAPAPWWARRWSPADGSFGVPAARLKLHPFSFRERDGVATAQDGLIGVPTAGCDCWRRWWWGGRQAAGGVTDGPVGLPTAAK